MIFDSHCHLQFPQYDQDREEMLARAFSAKINLICVGTDLESSKRAIELAHQHTQIWATVGLHPTEGAEGDIDISGYEKLLKMEKVVAVGEVGLDYYRTPESNKQVVQKKVFEKFLCLAVKNDKPVIIHSRDAGQGSVGVVHKDLLAILKNNLPPKRGVAHSFTGTIDEARQYLELGFYISFNGIITFARQYDDLVKFVPLDRILLETDAPYLAPEPYRGQRNEPAYIIEVAKKVAELKNESYDKVLKQTSMNCRQLFQISFKSIGFMPFLRFFRHGA